MATRLCDAGREIAAVIADRTRAALAQKKARGSPPCRRCPPVRPQLQDHMAGGALGCYHNTRGLWAIAYHPGKNSHVPFQDQCLQMTANSSTPTGWGPRAGVIRPGSDPQKYMNIGEIDLATGEMRVIYSQPQPSAGSALVTAGDLVFWGDQNRRFRAFDAESGKVLWEAVVGGMVMNSTISYAVNGKQYVMVFTGEGQSVTAGPLSLMKDYMPPAVHGHNAIYAFTLP